jgi:hypothetical protein
LRIEFKKVPFDSKDYILNVNSVEFLGNFRKISSKLIEINTKASGSLDVDCCFCEKVFTKPYDIDQRIVVCDGIYEPDDSKILDEIVFESLDGFVDFDEILQGEVESFRSDYHKCDSCENSEFEEKVY